MSDYLSRAAERVTSTNTTIRPVLPLFDTEKSPSDATSMMLESRVEHSTASRSVDAAPPMGQLVSDVGKRVASVLALAPEHSGEVLTEEKQTASNLLPARGTSPAQDAPTKEDRQTRAIPLRPTVTSAKSSPTRQPDDARAEQLPQPVRPRTIDRASQRSRPDERVIRFPHRRVAIPNQRRSTNSLSDDNTSSTGPAIQVTIGRLEVRAIQQAPAPPTPASKSPRMSLEEYLRSENKRSQ
jgi:hypothetical protein